MTSPAALLLETKSLLNSAVSDAKKGARFLMLDIKVFLLQSYLEDPKYMRINQNISHKHSIQNTVYTTK